MNFATNGVKIFVGYQYRYLLPSTAVTAGCRKVIDDLLNEWHPIISAISEIELLCCRGLTSNVVNYEAMQCYLPFRTIGSFDQAVLLL